MYILCESGDVYVACPIVPHGCKLSGADWRRLWDECDEQGEPSDDGAVLPGMLMLFIVYWRVDGIGIC